MSKAIYVLNGPNLNLLGVREPKLYGHGTEADLTAMCQEACARHGYGLVFHQSNAEYEIVGWLQEARTQAAGVIINPAAFCYYSVAILDSLRMVECPIVEVHISHIHSRDPEWRSKTITAAACTAMISGMGLHGYTLAIDYLAQKLKDAA